jgi:hypothetical protein
MTNLIDTRPQSVNISGYGGDTLTIKISAPAELTDGMLWKAQVRSARTDELIAAEFEIIPPEASGGPAYIVLDSEVSRSLVETAPVVRRRTTRTGTVYTQRYSGFWDCQLTDEAATDPKVTFVQGELTIDLDVTRP